MIAALMVGVSAVLRLMISTPDPAQVRFVESHSEQTEREEVFSGTASETGFSGKAFETAQRLREAAALGMAVSLSAFATYSAKGNLPAAEGGMLHDMFDRKLLPPGIEINGESIQSESSLIKLRYRREPFSFEIFSLPKNPSKGPAFLLKFPLPPGAPNSVMYFQSPNANLERIPAPFSTTEQLSSAGWSIRYWRGETLPLNDSVIRDLQENDAWPRSRVQK
jgi:hypothetical protein